MEHWTPYQPNAEVPWNIERVVHLHRRAAFAATWSEIQRDLKDGPDAAIQRLLNGHQGLEQADDFTRMAGNIGDAAMASNSPGSIASLVVLSHAQLARSAGRTTDADVAQPLRDEQSQGRQSYLDARAKRYFPRPRPQSPLARYLRKS